MKEETGEGSERFMKDQCPDKYRRKKGGEMRMGKSWRTGPRPGEMVFMRGRRGWMGANRVPSPLSLSLATAHQTQSKEKKWKEKDRLPVPCGHYAPASTPPPPPTMI